MHDVSDQMVVHSGWVGGDLSSIGIVVLAGLADVDTVWGRSVALAQLWIIVTSTIRSSSDETPLESVEPNAFMSATTSRSAAVT